MENSQTKTKLSVWECACIITGYGIGGGVLTMPYLASKNGILGALLILVLAFIATYLLHIMIAELAIKTGGDSQIVGVFSKYVFVGKIKVPATITFFVLMGVVIIVNLTAYISGAAEIIAGLFGMNLILCEVLFYVIAAVIALFGLKILGISEKYAVGIIFGVIAVLAVGSFFNIKNALSFNFGEIKDGLAFFGMAMFAFSAFFSVPQVVQALDSDAKKIKKAVFLGILNNFVLICVVVVCALLSSSEITEVAMVGWSKGIGTWAEVLGSVFTILAMLTTFWSLSLALSDMVKEQLKLKNSLCWLIATVPTLIIAIITSLLSSSSGFLDLLQTAAGAIAILVAIMVIPAYHRCKKDEGEDLLGKWGSLPMQIVVFIAYIFMAVGNLV